VVRKIILLAAFSVFLAVPFAGAQEVPPPTDPPPTPPATDPAAPPVTEPPVAPVPVLVPDGVSIDGIPVGGLTAEQAIASVQSVFDQPLQFRHGNRSWSVTPAALGATARVPAAVARALVAPPGSSVDLIIRIRGDDVGDYVGYLDRRFSREAKDATLRLVKLHPRISEPKQGLKLRKPAMRAAIVRALQAGERGPLELEATVLEPQVTRADFARVIVIRRETKRLVLYRGERFWRRFSIATGQPSYPTPLGRWEIVVKWRNPWWYPPPSPWAQDAEPVPPGPGNPLGTRWMGLSAPYVGIHGTPDSASIGYSASHGCIRMFVSEAEWLFDRVEIGTTVFIVPA
jgi:lipoprotein-anchoring transpeptidase ErfK/SrfK